MFQNDMNKDNQQAERFETISEQVYTLVTREQRYLPVPKPPSRGYPSSCDRWSPVSVILQEEPCQLTEDQNTRSTVCDWMYKIVDHFSLERESIPIGMSCFERYTAKYPSSSKYECQLVAVTSLFIAVKVYDVRRKDTLSFFAKLSSGRFTESDIEQMELKMLFGLKWLVNPPTPQLFVYNFIRLFLSMSPNLSHHSMTIYEVANYVAEISILNPKLSEEKASTLAFASLLVALREVNQEILRPQDHAHLATTILSFDFTTADKVTTVADEIEDSLLEDDRHLSMEQIYERLDTSGIVYNHAG